MTKTHRHVPVCSVTIDADVRLDEFSDSEIAEYLRRKGYYVSATSAVLHDQDGLQGAMDPDELNHIETLFLCGQVDAARGEALALIGNAIGRALQ